MIRPGRLRLYRVDLIAAPTVLALAIGGAALLLAPQRQIEDDFRQLVDQRRAAAAALQSQRGILHATREDTHALETLLGTQFENAPRPAGLNATRAAVIRAAEEAGIDIVSVTPTDPVPAGPYAISSLRIEGASATAGVLDFLATLGREHPHYSLRRLELHQTPGSIAPRVALELTFRLLRDDAPRTAPVGAQLAAGDAR